MNGGVKSKTYCVLDRLFLKFIESLEEYARNWDSYSEAERKRIQLLALIIKLGRRNETLAKLLFLRNVNCYYDFFWNEPLDPKQYFGKRGKRNRGRLPLKYIMQVLECSHRTAQAYSLYLKGEELADELFREVIKEVMLRSKAKEQLVEGEAEEESKAMEGAANV